MECMNELSLHILDLAQNSVAAKARLVEIEVREDTGKDALAIEIRDDGQGMDEDFLQRVEDPFTTSRTTRRVGMGIPLMKQNMQMAGGDLAIESAKGEGTRLRAWCRLSHIDRLPLGDLADTVYLLVIMNPGMDFVFRLDADGREFVMDTRQMRDVLGDIPLDNPDVSAFIQGYLREGLADIPFVD